MNRRLTGLVAVASLLGSIAIGWAVQPGTTGTEKQFQEMGLRSGVLIQRNRVATATAGAATLNEAGSGVITSEALVTAANALYTLTLTNNMVGAADIVLASVAYGTATTGSPVVTRITPAAGSVVIIVRNGVTGDAALNGTIKVSFLVIKQSANDAD